MSRIKLLVLIFMNILTLRMFSNENTVLDKIQNTISNQYYVIDYAFGNFISKENKSVIVLCDKVKNLKASKSVKKIYIYEIDDINVELWGELYAECSFYKEDLNSFYKSLGMLQDLSEIGEAHHFGWIGDFNDNGVTEIMFVQSSKTEEGATIEFWEFHDGFFKIILPAKDDICYIMNVNRSLHTMQLERSKYSEAIEEYIIKISEIKWDPKSNLYIENIKK
ncbi:MAG TPA: hypothetical protein VJZ01_09435 [Lachnospiraceae bacterium]|nr:hypothetical protein [Lachnospiraceae bacterium]